MNSPSNAARFRWFTLAVFVLSSSINYLDRQSLATLAPVLRSEFHLSNAEYGLILTAFSVTYAASAPFAGLLIDRIGLNRAIAMAVAVWSCAGIATGFTSGLGSLMACRAALGLSEAAGIPGAAKAIHQYLRPAERALGNAVNQAGVSLGLMLAPPVATWVAVTYGWRHAFVVTGGLGLLWIPLWLRISRTGPPAHPKPAEGRVSLKEDERSALNPKPARMPAPHAGTRPPRQVLETDPLYSGAQLSGEAAPEAAAPAVSDTLRDRRLWVFVAANALSMIGYSLWTNWTTLYLVETHHLTLVQAAWYAWIPPLAATLGGFAGGWLSLRWIGRGVAAPLARFRACLLGAVLSLPTIAIPAAPSAGWASAGISLGIFAVAAFSVNMYTLPLDVFGGARAAFAVSMLVASYGAVQAIVSPLFGKAIDLYGYTPVIVFSAFMPFAACAALWGSKSVR